MQNATVGGDLNFRFRMLLKIAVIHGCAKRANFKLFQGASGINSVPTRDQGHISRIVLFAGFSAVYRQQACVYNMLSSSLFFLQDENQFRTQLLCFKVTLYIEIRSGQLFLMYYSQTSHKQTPLVHTELSNYGKCPLTRS